MDRAIELEGSGADVIHLEKGEADLDTPAAVKERAVEALRHDHTRYTASAGLRELRDGVRDHYLRACGVRIDPSLVFVTAGSSPALLTLFLAALQPGDEVILPDPCYPAYPKLVEAAGGRPVHVPTETTGFSLAAAAVEAALTPRTAAIVVNSPSNPAGAVVADADLRAIARLGPLVVSDDVYRGLVFDGPEARCVLEHTDHAAIAGSFSKGFNMTGWRLGYSIVPERLAPRIRDLHENLFVSPNAFVQWAGVTALERAESLLADTREELRARRDRMLAGLARLGFDVPAVPRGGPYVFAKLPDRLLPTEAFARDLLEKAHVAVTPGGQFGPGSGAYVRFSCAAPAARIDEAMTRIDAFARTRELTEVRG
jgi:aspartate/methionine/tyrosine aminotransferase